MRSKPSSDSETVSIGAIQKLRRSGRFERDGGFLPFVDDAQNRSRRGGGISQRETLAFDFEIAILRRGREEIHDHFDRRYSRCGSGAMRRRATSQEMSKPAGVERT